MKRASPQPLLEYSEEIYFDAEEMREEESVEVEEELGSESETGGDKEEDGDLDDDNNGRTGEIIERMRSMILHNNKPDPTKRGEASSWQKTREAQREGQLEAQWTTEDLIDEQLDWYQAHHNRALFPTRPKDVAQLLMPNWVPPHELASLAWFGDWRPSSILELVRSLALTGSSPVEIEPLLSQLIHDARIEEIVLDEEMAEIQSTCIFHLPFGPISARRSGPSALASVLAEFRKMDRVIAKAQLLRSNTIEMVVTKVLGQTDAGDFLVAFAGIQDMIHQFAADQVIRKGPVSFVAAAEKGL